MDFYIDLQPLEADSVDNTVEEGYCYIVYCIVPDSKEIHLTSVFVID